MILEYKESLEDEAGKNVRVVFALGREFYAVVKLFDQDVKGAPRTVKFWELSAQGYEATKSFWRTRLPRVSSAREIHEAEALVRKFGSLFVRGRE